MKKMTYLNDFFIILIIPIILCILIPYFIYSINNSFEIYFMKFSNVKIYIYIVLKCICYFLVSLFLYILNNFKNISLKIRFSYLIGFILSIFSIIILVNIDYRVYSFSETQVILSITILHYFFKVIETVIYIIKNVSFKM